MHTGYDNFWMYQNIRHKSVLSFSKSDNCSHAVLTDNYKLLPNGRCPGYMSSYFTPQNCVASSHQSDHPRMIGSQCIWPSSVYSLTFRPSYVNNFQSPETYSSQSTSLNCSTQGSQVQQNYDSRHLKNTNTNFLQVLSNTNKSNNNHSNFVQTQSSRNNDTSISGIRVKDVFSLNNGTLQNSLFENNLLQTYQKEQPECELNYATINPFTLCNSKTPTEYVDYEKINLLKSNHPYPPYGHKTIEQTNHQKFLQHPDLFYQQNMPLSFESQFQFSDSKEMEKNFSSKIFNANSLTRQSSNPKKILKAKVQNIQRNSCDIVQKNKRIKVQSRRNSGELSNLQNSETLYSYNSREKTNNIHYSGSLETNEKVTVDMSKINRNAYGQNHYQENLAETDEPSSVNQVSLIGELRKLRRNTERVLSSSKCSQIRSQENNLIKITIPLTGQSTFLSINDCSGIEKNSTLPCLLESKNQVSNHTLNRKGPVNNHCKIEKNGVINLSLGQVNQGISINNKFAASNTNSAYSSSDFIQNDPNTEIEESDRSLHSNIITSPKKLDYSNESLVLKEHGVGLNNQKNYAFPNSGGVSENIFQNVNPKIFIEEESKSTKIISHNDTISKAIILKPENFYPEVENPGEPFISEDRILPKILKIERNMEDFFLNKHEPESSTSENQFLDVDDTENIDFSKANAENVFIIKKPGPKSKIISNALKNAENHIKELDISIDETGREAVFSVKNKMETLKTEKKKVFQSKRNYKSKINKEKLDLLIQFLNKDEETIETNASKATVPSHSLKKINFINKQEKEVHLSRNRRKLSKTCIVRNKNNSREMISLISHKVARMDIFKCSSKTPQIVQTVKSLDKNEKKTGESSSVIDRSLNSSGNCDKINNHSQENQTEKEDCLKFKSKVNVFEKKTKWDISEKYLSGKKNSIQEDNVSTTLRTFQNLKTHFCVSCNLISSVDSFWINVVSGELRCLNCFKKMMIKVEEHILSSESEKGDGNTNSETNLVQKDETKLECEHRKENMQKLELENKSGNCNGLISVTEFECDNQNSNDLKEYTGQELMAIINDSSIKNHEEVSFMSEYCTVNVTDFSNVSRRQGVSIKDKASILGKTVEDQNKLRMKEPLSKCVKNFKRKDDIAHRSKVLEEGPKQEIAELYERSKRKNITKGNEIVDETPSSKAEVSLFKSKQINVLKKKCWASKTFLLNLSNKKGKSMLKERSINLKAKLLKNYNEEENLSGQSMKKSNFIESCITNKTEILKKITKLELTDKSEESGRKNTFKEECISEEIINVEGKKSTDSPILVNRKKTNSKEEFPSRKLQISEEHSKKDVKLDEFITKTCLKENYSWQKIHNSEDVVKRNTKHEPLDKLKILNASKEICSNQRQKISEQLKSKETHISEKSKRKYLPAQNIVEWTKQSIKRKNIEGFTAHKIRIVQKHAKKEIKLVTHSSNGSKEIKAYRKKEALEHEKQNAKNSEEKPLKKSLSKEKCLNSGNLLKKKANQLSESSEKSKTKGGFKTSELSKHRRNSSSEMPRRKSKDVYISLKPAVAKENPKNETKRLMESPNKLKRNSMSKEDSDTVSKHFKNDSLPTKNKECKKTEGKEKKHIMKTISKKSHAGSDININEVFRSLNYGSERIPNKEECTRIKKEFRNIREGLLKAD